MKIDLLIHGAAQVVTCASTLGPKRGAAMADAGVIDDGAVAISRGQIVEVGHSRALLKRHPARKRIDAAGKVVCPGFVDPHTHAVYAGDRIGEFERRIRGETYQEIAAAGGGIMATVRATREASLNRIVAESRARLAEMLRLGTTTAEVKTGYGLDPKTELKLLRAIGELDHTQAVELVPTFLGAHAVPAEFAGRAEAYVRLVIERMLPAALRWYRRSAFSKRNVPFFVDVFCERNAFDVSQSRRVLAAARALGLPVKAHVDEFSRLGGLEMALELGATSVDHLDETGDDGIRWLTASDSIAVIIPTVTFNLGSTRFAKARAMIDAGAAVALTTDINPGSAPCPSMPLAMAIATRYQKLSPAEALNAASVNAAHAIGLGDRVGSLAPGMQADLLIVDAPDYRHLAYQFGGNLVQQVFKKGRLVA
jgi:imidazolonepropionase